MLSAAAGDDAAIDLAAHDCTRDQGAVERVVDGLFAVGSEIDRFVPEVGQHLQQVLLEREARVVAADRHLHAATSAARGHARSTSSRTRASSSEMHAE